MGTANLKPKANIQADVAVAERLIFTDAGNISPAGRIFKIKVNVEGGFFLKYRKRIAYAS